MNRKKATPKKPPQPPPKVIGGAIFLPEIHAVTVRLNEVHYQAAMAVGRGKLTLGLRIAMDCMIDGCQPSEPLRRVRRSIEDQVRATTK